MRLRTTARAGQLRTFSRMIIDEAPVSQSAPHDAAADECDAGERLLAYLCALPDDALRRSIDGGGPHHWVRVRVSKQR
jgi:hypothetical protein